MLKTYYFFLICMGWVGCTTPVMDEAELQKFIMKEENGLSKEVKVNDQSIRVTYRPVDLVIYPEVKAAGLKEEQKIREVAKDYEQYMYFVLSLSAADEEITNQSAGHKEGFENAIKQLSFRMNEHVKIVSADQDTVPLADYLYPRMFGSTASTSLILAFNKEKLIDTNYFDFCLDDFGFGTGNQKFRFKLKDLKNTPRLNFNAI